MWFNRHTEASLAIIKAEGWGHLKDEYKTKLDPESHAHNFIWIVNGVEKQGVSIHWHERGNEPHEHFNSERVELTTPSPSLIS